VIDTNVLAGALLRREGQNRDVLRRQHLFRRSPLAPAERLGLLEAFLSVCEWVQVYYLWRPNPRDEGDNHILALAVAGGASMIVTNNVADFRGSELRFSDIQILSPKTLLKELA
jgi:uncharacterized protein